MSGLQGALWLLLNRQQNSAETGAAWPPGDGILPSPSRPIVLHSLRRRATRPHIDITVVTDQPISLLRCNELLMGPYNAIHRC